MPPQVILIWHLISLWKTSLATSQIFGYLARCMKTIYYMVAKGCCKTVFAKLQKHFDDKLVVFYAPGLSSLLVFRNTVPSVFKLVDDNDDDGMIQNISKAIHRECKHLVHDKNKYTIQVDKQTGINSVSATLISLLENLSDSPWFKLPSIVIGNIITVQSQISQHHFKLDLVLPLARKALCNNFMILVSVAHMMNYCGISSSGCIKQNAIDRYPVIKYGSGASHCR